MVNVNKDKSEEGVGSAEDSENEEAKVFDRTSILERVIEKTTVAILTGLTLALLNYYFWEKKEEAARSELYIQNKIETYSESSQFFTLLITTHNRIVAIRRNNQLTKLSADDRDRLNKLEEKASESLTGLSKQLTHANIYFSKEAVDKLRAVQKQLATHSSGEDGFFSLDSPIVKDILDATGQMAKEVRYEFRGINSPNLLLNEVLP